MLFHLDGPEKLEVNDGKEGEGNEGHPQEVGDEDVVPRVGKVCTEAGGTQPGKSWIKIAGYLTLLLSLQHLGTGTNVVFMLPLMLTMVMFIIFK